MSYFITRKSLFKLIKDKELGSHPEVRVTDLQFAQYAEDALFNLFGDVDKENISKEDSSKVTKFILDFVKRCKAYWKERNVHSNMNVMFSNHPKYFEDNIDFGELKPPDPIVVVNGELKSPKSKLLIRILIRECQIGMQGPPAFLQIRRGNFQKGLLRL